MCAFEYYTYDDYKKWRGDWELIDGIAYAMAPSPIFSHQYIAFEVAFEMRKNNKCENCKIVLEEDYIIDEYNVLRPDISFVCNHKGEYIKKAPKIVVEVVSKSTQKRDEKIKFEIYEKEKVEYYILVYPDLKKARAFKLVNGKYEKIGDFVDEVLEIECTKIDFKNVFKGI